MIHHSCDGCKRLIDPQHSLRYVLRMEVYAAMETSDTDSDEGDRDHLTEIHDILEHIEDTESDELGDNLYQQLRFDLCPECRQKFLNNPIARDASTQLDFSEN